MKDVSLEILLRRHKGIHCCDKNPGSESLTEAVPAAQFITPTNACKQPKWRCWKFNAQDGKTRLKQLTVRRERDTIIRPLSTLSLVEFDRRRRTDDWDDVRDSVARVDHGPRQRPFVRLLRSPRSGQCKNGLNA